MIKVIGVRFRQAGKVYYFDPLDMDIKRGDHVIVETARGVEYGNVVMGLKEVEEDKVVLPLKPVIRVATKEDDKKEQENWVIGPFHRPEGVNPVLTPQPTSFYCPMRKDQEAWS